MRTTNPLNPENLGSYTTKVGSNRPNAYQLPNAFLQRKGGLPLFEEQRQVSEEDEDREQCGGQHRPARTQPENEPDRLGGDEEDGEV